ncbi:helix-turn-helix domain-containing protein [Stakelama tenebrarum]|uniref:DUF4019 domain-containing protein n=1 Tax=Stakelama tenebrarum TaxID=2711215 RepID=A0A6G6Y7L7_9SPHN|nr:DUF4019 domain-containing protein [Sphingosinithalassobacter tenebrarum]QIG80566.1 DUF4019 domain-containing protein [Sphingosinithalassobacter tenebrarum]
MHARENDGSWGLTEKEKQTLRLMVRGHDAKSIARDLGLSVHTINDRLRDARRKMEVSSSREAARLLLDAEGQGTPESLADKEIGADAAAPAPDQKGAPVDGAGIAIGRPQFLIGAVLMTLTLGLLAFLAVPQPVTTAPALPAGTQVAPDPAVVDAARQWLALLDEGRWDDSYLATAAAFRELNTAQVWSDASERVRTPLGAMVSRTFLRQEYVPAPPQGYQLVKFRTSFANRAEAIETVTLEQEDGVWRVAGVTVE